MTIRYFQKDYFEKDTVVSTDKYNKAEFTKYGVWLTGIDYPINEDGTKDYANSFEVLEMLSPEDILSIAW